VGDHIVIKGLIEELIIRDRPTELDDAEDAAVSLAVKLGGEMEHKLVVSLYEFALPPLK
jgi:hypothetical protein